MQIIEDGQVTTYTDRPNNVGDRFNVTINSEGSQIAYTDYLLSKIYLRNISKGSLGAEQLSAFDVMKWAINPGPGLKINWRPNTTQLFAYSYWSPPGIYTYLLDVQSGQVCKINLYTNERLASLNYGLLYSAKWSSNGRYLAVVLKEQPDMASSSSLVVLDIVTGKLYQMDAAKFSPVGAESIAGEHYVEDIVWAPDNRHLLVIGNFGSLPHCSPNCFEYYNLYLADFITGEIDPVLLKYQLNISNNGSLAWSPDGSKVLALCPELCLITVQKTNQ